MKRLTLLLCLATFAAVATSRAQMAEDSNSISGIKRPVPSASATPAADTKGPKKPLEATLALDEKGKKTAMTFAASTPKIYLQWKDDSATKGEKIRAVWVAESAAPFSKNQKLTENDQTLPGPGAFGSFFVPAPEGGFPVGKYHVALYEGDKLVKTLLFSVKK